MRQINKQNNVVQSDAILKDLPQTADGIKRQEIDLLDLSPSREDKALKGLLLMAEAEAASD